MRFLLDLLFPPKCILCHKLLKNSQEELCQTCAMEVLRQNSHYLRGKHFSKCVAPLAYEGNVRDSLQRYKFGGREFYAKTYGAWLAACIRRELEGDFDMISYVPISRRRRRKREYDQSELLAKRVGEILHIPVVKCLKKIKDNPAQSGITDYLERKKNVAGVYMTVEAEVFADKRILLVDDIATTGATLEECSKMLVKAGAKHVVCATLAMTK